LDGNVEHGDFWGEGDDACDVFGVFVNILRLIDLDGKETETVGKN
jgi:hypothetical protein